MPLLLLKHEAVRTAHLSLRTWHESPQHLNPAMHKIHGGRRERANIEGISLEYEVTGSGEPVVLIHGALIAETFRPLLSEPSLSSRYQLIRYLRRGYMGSSHVRRQTSIEQHVSDCLALLGYLGVKRTHVVGHSYGGSVALQLALHFPDQVHSLALLEPALFASSTGSKYREALARGQQRYREVGPVIAVDEFFQPRFGPGYRAMLDRILLGGFAQAAANAETWFEWEAPAMQTWNFSEDALRRITQPVLAVLGSESNALWSRFGETYRLLLSSLPDVEGFILPGTTHLLHTMNPRDTAEILSDFYKRHPMLASAT